MITLYRKFKLWQLRTKWQLAIWQMIDKQAMKLVKEPEELEKKIILYLAELIHKTNSNAIKIET